MDFKSISIAATLTAISLIALTTPATATAYRNANIYLELREGGLNVADGPGGPIGTATYKSGSWTGNVTPITGGMIALPNVVDSQGNTIQGARKLYVGTFSEMNSGVTCTGDVTILRSSQGQGMGANLAQITRTITGGNSLSGCAIGTTTVESTAAPRPQQSSSNGDFTASQANTLKGNTATWWRWVATAPTQCRTSVATPLFGATLPARTNLNARFASGSGNQIIMSGGVPWLRVRNPNSPPNACFVRANISDIQAVDLLF